jgi:hypothetical protein
MKQQIWFSLILLAASTGALHAQEVELQKKTVTEPNELSLGVNLNTQMSLIGGFAFKYNRQVSDKRTNGFLLELAHVKNKKEISVSISNPNGTSSSYAFGKFNNLFCIRPMFSKQFRLFYKAKDEGVELWLNTAMGPVLGLESPYYVLVESNSSDSSGYIPYSKVQANQNIIGHGNMFMGLGESKVVPGGTFRLSGNFEFGAYRDSMLGIEAGTQVDAFSRKIQSIPYTGEKSVYISAFILIYMGIRW